MHNDYSDIRDRIQEQPKWFDECAVPRYCDFAPRETANIYAEQRVLAEVDCQNCGRMFRVAFSWGVLDGCRGVPSLEQDIRDRALHYGDPPNIQCCPAGPTMNSVMRRVVEFWRQAPNVWDFERVTELEVEFEQDNSEPETP